MPSRMLKTLLRGMKDIPDHEIKRKELAYKATRDVLKAVGLYPSPFVMNVNNDNRQQTAVINPDVFQIIGRFLEESDKDTGET